MIEVKGLTKRYGKHIANDNISLKLQAGEVGVLLGPNGAGKSTLIKSICGLLKFEGEIYIDGHINRSLNAKRVIGYVPELPTPYPLLTVREHLEFIARAYRLKDWEEYADELLNKFDLEDKQNKLGKELSKGMKQKVSICCAMLHKPKFIIFDEPLSGLDPHGMRELQSAMEDLNKMGTTMLVSTHNIDSVEKSWNITFIMKKGQMIRECRRENEAETLEDIYFSLFDKKELDDE